jgi:hypothetical protein
MDAINGRKFWIELSRGSSAGAASEISACTEGFVTGHA